MDKTCVNILTGMFEGFGCDIEGSREVIKIRLRRKRGIRIIYFLP